MKWLNHVERIDVESLTGGVREKKILGNVRKGRLDITWKESVENDTKNEI